jgi:hypothetical protein
MGLVLHPFIVFSKEFIIHPLPMKCAIAQERCFKNGKTPIVLSLFYLRDVSSCKRHAWDKDHNFFQIIN